VTSTERQDSEDYGTSNEDNQPNYPEVEPNGTRDDKGDVSANALEKARALAESGSKIFDTDSLKANQTSVLEDTKLLGLTDRDIQELMNDTERSSSTSSSPRRKTSEKGKKEVTLLDVSKQLEKQRLQLERITQSLAPLQKQAELVQRQPKLVNQMRSQMNHIEKQISYIHKSLGKAPQSKTKGSLGKNRYSLRRTKK
jgi:hypothetical protein